MRKEQIINKLEERERESYSLLYNEISKDFINEYTLEDECYICDAISYFSDENVSIYYYDLKEWLRNESESIEYMERVAQDGFIDFKNYDFYKHIQIAQYEQVHSNIYEDLDVIIDVMIIKYLIDNDSIIEKFEDFEELENFIIYIDKDHNNKFEDIKSELDSLLESEEN